MTTKFVNCYRGQKCVASYQIDITDGDDSDDAFTLAAKLRMTATGFGAEPFTDCSFIVRSRFPPSQQAVGKS